MCSLRLLSLHRPLIQEKVKVLGAAGLSETKFSEVTESAGCVYKVTPALDCAKDGVLSWLPSSWVLSAEVSVSRGWTGGPAVILFICVIPYGEGVGSHCCCFSCALRLSETKADLLTRSSGHEKKMEIPHGNC